VCAEETDVPLKFVGYLVSIKKGIRVDAICMLDGEDENPNPCFISFQAQNEQTINHTTWEVNYLKQHKLN